MNEELAECVTATLGKAEDARLHMGAMLEILRACPPDYPLQAWLYLSNLDAIHARLVKVIDGLRMVNGQQLAL